LVRSLKLDAPESWVPPEFVGPLEAQAQSPTFRTTNQVDVQGNPVVDPTVPGTWRGTADAALNALVGTVKGVTGLGDQGPAGPSWQNFGALAAAVPIGLPETFLGALANKMPRFAKALQAYHAPTEAGRLAAPFYSRLDDTVATLPKQFGAGALAKGGASAEELAMRGVPAFLSQQGTRPIAKSALEGHLAAHPVPELQVKTLGGPASAKPMPPGYHISPLAPGNRPGAQNNYTLVGPDGSGRAFYATDAADAQMMANDMLGLNTKAPTKFSQYQLPGGTNYRETLITLPTPRPDQSANEAQLKVLEAKLQSLYQQAEGLGRRGPDALKPVWAEIDATQAEARALNKAMSQDPPNQFHSGHFDEPNILVHTRSNEREIPGLGKGTFLEEVQSDWHQKGKDAGYQRNLPKLTAQDVEVLRHIPNEAFPRDAYWETYDRRTGDLISRHPGAHTEDRVLLDALELGPRSEPGVPDAPFKDTWPDLALKHHLAEAAQNPETQWIGFTSGQTQAARYDLSKQVSKVMYDESSHTLTAWDNPGRIRDRRMVMQETVKPDKVADYIGKEAAQKLLGVAPDDEGTRILEGLDLKVGGEGMHHFYDNLLPKRLEKIVKPYGGTVERLEMPQPLYDMTTKTKNLKEREPIWVLRLTPELKQRILRYGLPLLTGVAAVDLATKDR
jgi:hypothetical protein